MVSIGFVYDGALTGTICGTKATSLAPIIGGTLSTVLSYTAIVVTAAVIVCFIGYGLYRLFKKWF